MKKIWFLLFLFLAVGAGAKEPVCSADRPMKVSRLCGYEGKLYFVTSGNCPLNTCVACDTPMVYVTTAEECAKCPNRVLRGNINGKGFCGLKDCPSETPLSDFGVCTACETEAAAFSTPEECARCPNRKMAEYENQAGEKKAVCVLKDCPEDMPVRSKYMDCVPCEGASDNFQSFTKDECQACSYMTRWENGVCRGICPTTLMTQNISEECNMCFAGEVPEEPDTCRLCVRRDGTGYCQMKK